MTPELIEQNYKRGVWTVRELSIAVAGGFITKEKFKDISGLDYDELKKKNK